MAELKDRLKELREKSKLSQKQLAIKINISDRNYQRYEYGEREPNASTIISLANFYGVTTDYLLGRTDNPNAVLFSMTSLARATEEMNLTNEPTLRAASGLTEDTDMEALESDFAMLDKLAEEKKNKKK